MIRCQVLGGIFFMLMVTSLTVGQTTDPTATRVRLKRQDVNVSTILVAMAVQCDVSIGFERSDLDRPEIKLSVDEKQSTVREVLDHIIKEVPIYKWELRGNVINLVPVRGRSRMLEDLLRTDVQEFQAKGNLNKFDLRNQVLDLPEVQLLLNSYNVRTQRLRDYVSRRSIYANDADLSMSGTDVLGILNNIIAKSEYNLWILTHDGKGTLCLSF